MRWRSDKDPRQCTFEQIAPPCKSGVENQSPAAMSNDLLIILGVASAAAVASPLGGMAAMALRPSSLVLSVAVGFAAGVLMGTFAFEMMPTSVKLAGLALAVAGFLLGLALVYILDLYVNRWKMAVRKQTRKRRSTVSTGDAGRAAAM